jgi:glycosyltransferase involved in cell wall biosynthesis
MKSKEIKLVYVVNALLPNSRAHGIQIINTCEAVGNIGIDLTLLSPKLWQNKNSLSEYYDISQSFNHLEIATLDIPKFPLQFLLRLVTFSVFTNVYLLYLYLITLFTNKKLVVYVRGEAVFSLLLLTLFIPVFFETHQIRNYEKMYRFVLKHVKGIIVITERLKKKFVEEYGIDSEKILVARDSVDVSRYSGLIGDKALWRNYGIRENKIIVLYSGSLTSEKGVHTLVQSAKHLSSNVQVVIMGGNETQIDAIKAICRNDNKISVIGHIDHKLVPKYISSADVLVLPDLSIDIYSNLYTSPMKLFEYMASGKIILASDIPSLREVLTEDSAVFFQSGNEISLASKIKEILNDYENFNKKAQVARDIVSEFTWEKRALQITRLIENKAY